MASGGINKSECRRPSNSLILKEGFLHKKGDIIKTWSRKYFVLTRESLCYFKRESETREPIGGRVFLSDVVNIATDGLETKRSFVFALNTKRRSTLLQGSNNDDKNSWVCAIKNALETDKEAERKDPFRKTLRRLERGVKRVTLFRDPQKGIGCTIKNAAGHILVNRIIEDGPIAVTGVLRPGDEILDIHGTPVTGLQIQEIGDIIKSAPEEFLATVRPLTVLKRDVPPPPGNTKVIYSTIVPIATSQPVSMATSSPQCDSGNWDALQSCDPLDDVGTYDDDDGDETNKDTPPAVPKRTDEALELLLGPSPARGLNLKASSEGDLMRDPYCEAPPFPTNCSSPPPPPIPQRTTASLMIDDDHCLLPPKQPQQPQPRCAREARPGVAHPAHAQSLSGKSMTRCLSEDNALWEPTREGGVPQPSAGNTARDSRSLQRSQRMHDYDEITPKYADLEQFKFKAAGKR